MLVLVGTTLMGCAPGRLPCDKDDDWRRICADAGTPGSGGSPGSGGTPAAGGTSGTGGAGMGGNGGGVNASTAVADCSAFDTVGKMDQFFKTRCADGAGCHKGALAISIGDYDMDNVWQRVATRKTLGSCAGANLVDPGGDLAKSILWVKTQDTPTCPDGKTGGARMPTMPAMALDAAERKCLEGYIKALASTMP